MSDFRYIRIASRFWQDEKIKVISDDARLLYLYVLTSHHSNMIGYYIMPKPYVCYDLQWSAERLDKPFAELLETGLIKYCDKSDVVLVPNFLKYNTIQNQNQAKAAVKRLQELPANTLVDDFTMAVKHFAKPFAELLYKGLPKPYADPVTVSVTVTGSGSGSVSACACEEEKHDEEQSKEKTLSEIRRDDYDDNDDIASRMDDAFCRVFGYPPNQTQVEMLCSFLDDGLTEWHILEALKRTAETGANSPSYTRAILQNWCQKQAFTKEAVERLDKLWRPRSRITGPVTADDYSYSKPKQNENFFPFLKGEDDEDNGASSLPSTG